MCHSWKKKTGKQSVSLFVRARIHFCYSHLQHTCVSWLIWTSNVNMLHVISCKCQFLTIVLKTTSWLLFRFRDQKVIKVRAILYERSYPCYAGNPERWRCPARQHWLPAHWSVVSCECVPRSTLIGAKIRVYELYVQAKSKEWLLSHTHYMNV